MDPQRPPDASPVPSVFLPAERTAPAELAAEIAHLARAPLVTALLNASGSAAFVLDGQRQVVAANTEYPKLLGLADPCSVLGLRPGEAAHCVRASQAPSGCGTGAACASCGLVLAVLLSGDRGAAQERNCALSIERAGVVSDRVFRARAGPLDVEGERFTLVTLRDITEEERRAFLGRVFLHDLANLAVGIRSATDALDDRDPEPAEGRQLQLLADQLAREVRLQRALLVENPSEYQPRLEPLALARTVDLLRATVAAAPSASGKRFEVEAPEVEGGGARADETLLLHVLVNMLVNAFEATPEGGAVRLIVDQGGDSGTSATRFRVWNAGAIPAAVVPRIFQRFFSTKTGAGRGYGTYAMKLFGEQLLRGKVRFTTSESEGTWFELLLPRQVPAASHRPHPLTVR
jgi:signal transduction histidine kinase